MSPSWEYQNFVYALPKGLWYRQSTEADVQVDLWRKYRADISAQMQRWFDKGWSPLVELGSPCIRVRRSQKWQATKGTLWMAISFAAPQIANPFMTETVIEPIDFYVPMRRRKKSR